MALMLVLNLVFMVAALASAMLQFGSLAASGALAAVEHVRAFHAADAVMMLCEQHVLAQRARERDIPDGPLPVFGRDARWPGSIRLPECAVERIAGSRTRREGYRITARGFGSMADTQSWTQLDLTFAPGTLHRIWRPLAGRPVPDPWRGAPRTGDPRQSSRPARRRIVACGGKHSRSPGCGAQPWPSRLSCTPATGLSLIETMIALAVAAIIAGYAVPTYRQHLARVHRLSAALAVRQAAQYLEGRQLFDHAGGAMHEAGARGQGTYGTQWPRLPAHLARAPADGPVVYRLRVDGGRAPGPPVGDSGAKAVFIGDMTPGASGPNATSYWIVAVPVESGPMAGDVCGSFILDGSGRRSNTGTASAEQCWSGA